MVDKSTTVRTNDSIAPPSQRRIGLMRMQALASGQLEPPPIQRLVGFELQAVAPGRATVTLDVQSRHYNPMGTLHGGILCDVGDAAMGCATMTTLDEGQSFTTIALDIAMFKPIRSGQLLAVGTVVRRTRSIAYVECEVTDEDGRLVAKLSSTCMVLSGSAAVGR